MTNLFYICEQDHKTDNTAQNLQIKKNQWFSFIVIIMLCFHLEQMVKFYKIL